MLCVSEVCECDGMSTLERIHNIRSNRCANMGQFQLTGINHHFCGGFSMGLIVVLLKAIPYDNIQRQFQSP